MTHRIYVVEDHPVMRQGYGAVIGQEMDLEICGEAGSAGAARQDIPDVDPDLVVVDLSLEGGSGLELIKDLQAHWPDLPILVVSMHDESLYAERVLQAGARGYLMKSEADTKVVEAIRKILSGGVYLSEDMNAHLLMQFAGGKSAESSSSLAALSDRELEVFEYMGRGLTTREIADELALSPKTIDSYRSRVKDKLAIDSNAQLRRHATMWVEQQGADIRGD
jgi:DNA-binding NarL/FixJ family response regulator